MKCCKVCGIKFESSSNAKKYCSDDCFQIMRQLQRKATYNRNKDKYLLKRRVRYHSEPEFRAQILECCHKSAEKNKETIAKKKKIYYIENRTQISDRVRKWRLDNIERVKLYEKTNAERRKGNKFIWRLTNVEHVKTYQKLYNAKNAEKIKQYSRDYGKEYRKKNKEVLQVYDKYKYDFGLTLPLAVIKTMLDD